ncbi:MAG: hypothetical protein PHT88_01890 [Candidatus Moranbacteria bacterium]|nr:hypothetical protein [Candidatus Moranbacteria bacterium]
MSQKQKVLGVAAALVIVLALAFLYNQFSSVGNTPSGLSVGTTKNTASGVSTRELAPAATIPATPDATVDAIIDEVSFDDQALQDDVTSEKEAISASGTEINNLSQTYDENQL